MSDHSQAWTLAGAAGETIYGNVDRPEVEPRGVMLIAHGFKGYKDYGMFPVIARACAEAGFVVHRFNFSHSGMTDNVATFEHPELFERDTWNRQVEDLGLVTAAVRDGVIDGRDLPQVHFGHSRGGVTVLLAAGRGVTAPASIITAAAPSTCLSLDQPMIDELMRTGYLVSPSARTGQELRVGKAFVQEQVDDPAAHDLLNLVTAITCPMLIIHGDEDPTVPVDSARAIAAVATDARAVIIRGGDHVFNTPNPATGDPSPQLRELIEETVTFATRELAL